MAYTGLTTTEVQQRISQGLVNKSSKQKTKTISEIFIENIFSVFNLIIFSVVVFLFIYYIKTGNTELVKDTVGVSTAAILNLLIAIIQEIKAKRALDKVNLLLKKDVTVIRGGENTIIQQEDVVQDDLILLERGDQIIVDGKMVEANHIEIDESLLTGESVPIIKKENDIVLSGSFCIAGNGIYQAEKIGDHSYAMSVTGLAKKYKFVLTPLQKKINIIVQALFVIALILVAVELSINWSLMANENIEFIRKISTIVMSLVPQGLVLLASVSFALGVYRISKIGAIIQKLNAIESFSNVQIVCMDKTGTLTQNKLSVNRITLAENSNEEEIKKLLGTYALHSSDKNATLRAIDIFDGYSDAKFINEIPFSSETKKSFLEVEIKNEKRIFVLGGYDILSVKLDSVNRDFFQKAYTESNLKIYRNLLFGEIKNIQNLDSVKSDLSSIEITPLSIVSITDQIRTDVMDAINLFLKNGITFKILSGDAPESVQAVAREIGWDISDDKLITGAELEKYTDEEEFTNAVLEKYIFARLKPEHKLRIIKALKKRKIYTAMIGDGVNDLPAIKESDMGIAMEEGSKITKEIADIVLLKNKFSLLPDIFLEGNKIVNSVSSVAKLFLTKNMLVIFLTVLSLSAGLAFPITPRRIALLNIFAIGLPSFLITLKNSITDKTKLFLPDLFSFVALSSSIIVSAGYLGKFVLQSIYGLQSDSLLNMVMISVIIITAITNFLCIVLTRTEPNKKLYIMYGAMLVTLFLFFSFVDFDNAVVKILTDFYEIKHLDSKYFLPVISVGLACSVVLFFLQKIRKYILFGIKK
ncbi:MAG: HAD-IC family P-type ATPase [Bacteroidetes bacterium]|nr:HAD-IC family P-type ATPase [Bacteroidota bacterium]